MADNKARNEAAERQFGTTIGSAYLRQGFVVGARWEAAQPLVISQVNLTHARDAVNWAGLGNISWQAAEALLAELGITVVESDG